jgi:hypothetical protein
MMGIELVEQAIDAGMVGNAVRWRDEAVVLR